jgi:hypothetical protein
MLTASRSVDAAVEFAASPLKAGDVVEVEKLGILSNPVVDEQA